MKRAKKASPSEAAEPRTLLRREDPVAFGAWLSRLRAQADDVIAVAYDATSPPSDRRLSRAYARQLLEEAESALGDLLAMAQPPDQD